MPTRRPLVIAAALLALLSGIAGSTALAASDRHGEKASQAHGGGVALHVPQSVRSSLQLRGARLLPKRRRGPIRLLGHDAARGETRLWLGLDLAYGALYPKPFTFRGAGKRIEVWVAGDSTSSRAIAATARGRRSATRRSPDSSVRSTA